jgi:hypothetical protein
MSIYDINITFYSGAYNIYLTKYKLTWWLWASHRWNGGSVEGSDRTPEMQNNIFFHSQFLQPDSPICFPVSYLKQSQYHLNILITGIH